jgi:hypothetical protein
MPAGDYRVWALTAACLAPLCGAQPLDGDVGAGSAPLTVAVDDATLSAEGNAGTTNVQVPVRLSRIPGVPVKVVFATADGSARGGPACAPGVDYVAISRGSVAFGVRDSVQNIAIAVCGDAVNEDPQVFSIKLTSADGARIADSSGELTIQDDDPLPGLSFKSAPVAEGDVGTTSLPFEAKLSAASERVLNIGVSPMLLVASGDVRASGGSACSGADYINPPSPVAVEPGQTSKMIEITVCGDASLEPDETVGFQATLVPASAPFGNTLTVGVAASSTILNDDPPVLSMENLSVAEGGGSTLSPVVVLTPARLTVRLSQPTTKTVSARVQTKDGSATGGSACPGTAPAKDSTPDYVSLSGNVTIRPGDLSATVALTICPDQYQEPDESFGLALSDAVNARIEAGEATVRIRNDD